MTKYKHMIKNTQVVLKHFKEPLDNSTFTVIKNIATNLIKREKYDQMKWGRWNLDYCNVKQEIKSNNANRDHCGDVICGSPEILKETYGK